MDFKPLADRLLVAPVEAEGKTPHGIILPDSAKEKPMQGKVLAVGPGIRKDDGTRMVMDVSVGEVVLYVKFAGIEIKIGDEKRLILKEGDILGIVE